MHHTETSYKVYLEFKLFTRLLPIVGTHSVYFFPKDRILPRNNTKANLIMSIIALRVYYEWVRPSCFWAIPIPQVLLLLLFFITCHHIGYKTWLLADSLRDTLDKLSPSVFRSLNDRTWNKTSHLGPDSFRNLHTD